MGLSHCQRSQAVRRHWEIPERQPRQCGSRPFRKQRILEFTTAATPSCTSVSMKSAEIGSAPPCCKRRGAPAQPQHGGRIDNRPRRVNAGLRREQPYVTTTGIEVIACPGGVGVGAVGMASGVNRYRPKKRIEVVELCRTANCLIRAALVALFESTWPLVDFDGRIAKVSFHIRSTRGRNWDAPTRPSVYGETACVTKEGALRS